MIFPTKGIVLSTIPYKENSIIARIFTEKFGFQSYIVQSVRSAKSKNKIALFQPLTLLDLMVYHKENRDLHHISELSCEMPFHDIPFSIYKTSVAWVLAEIIQKCIPLHEDEQLFTFLHDSIVIFDNLKENNSHFLLLFLFNFSKFLGFVSTDLEEMQREISVHFPKKHFPMNVENYQLFEQIIQCDYTNTIVSTLTQRQVLLDFFVSYYQIHVDNLGELKTLPILKEILH